MKSQRGQSLTLFAVGLFLITVMIAMSLSVQMKIRERIELQTAADAAAFSTAVITARTFNSISLLNRAQISHMVAVGGVQSLVSWTSLYRAHVQGAQDALGSLVGETQAACTRCKKAIPVRDCSCECVSTAQLSAEIPILAQALRTEEKRIAELWDDKDKDVGDQAKSIRGVAAGMYELSTYLFDRDLRFYARPQRVAWHVAAALAAGNPWPEFKVPYANDFVSIYEIDHTIGRAGDEPLERHVEAAMGTRGASFITGRGADGQFTRRLQEIRRDAIGENARIELTATGGGGSTYFGEKLSHGGTEPTDTFLWAEDHGVIQVSHIARGTCDRETASVQAQGEAWVKASKSTCGCGVVHYWTGGGDEPGGEEHHSLTEDCSKPEIVWPIFDGPRDHPPPTPTDPPPCEPCSYDGEGVPGRPLAATALPLSALLSTATGMCVDEDRSRPNIWPPFLHHEVSNNAADVFGQPKLYSVVQRDYSKRTPGADPWNVLNGVKSFFGGDSQIDNSGMKLRDGTDISLQTAMATGIAYYHHPGQGGFRVDANFLNPFWRATLVNTEIDKAARDGDVYSTLHNSGAKLGGRVYQQLRLNKYQGF